MRRETSEQTPERSAAIKHSASGTSKLLWLEFALVLVLLAAVSYAAAAYVNHSGWTLYYGDAEAHLDIARRIVDSRNAGYEQIGTVWLPLPHLLMLPFVRNDRLWRSGLAGAIPSAVCFVLAGLFLYSALRRATNSAAAAMASVGLLALNPNLLYLQAIPMTETVVLAALTALLYFTVWFGQRQSYAAMIGAGLAGMAASLARYEGWFVIPFVAMYFLAVGRQRRFFAAAVFSIIAALGPLYWLAHNQWLYSNPLEFFNGPYSPTSIYRRAVAHNMMPYPGDHDWRAAAIYYLTAVQLCAGWVTVGLGVAGVAIVVFKRLFWPVLLFALPPVFYILSLHSGGTPIFVPSSWPFSYYNTRYALTALPLLAIAGGSLVLIAPRRWRPWIAGLIVIGAATPWVMHRQPSQWIAWKESQVNSIERRAWIKASASALAGQYHSGEGIMTSFGDLTGIFRDAGIPLRETLYEGDEPAAMAALARPDLFLHEEWAVAFAGDPVASAIQRTSMQTGSNKAGPRYRLVQTVKVKGAPVIEIYKRD